MFDMQIDGEKDCSVLSDAELHEARVRVDQALRPVDHQNIRREIARRKAKRRIALLPLMLRLLGAYFLLCAVWSIKPLFTSVLMFSRSGEGLMVILAGVPLTIMSALSGVLLLEGSRRALYMGAIAATTQLLGIRILGATYQYVPFVGLNIGILKSDIGFSAALGPRVAVGMEYGEPSFVMVNVIAAYALAVIIRGMRQFPAASGK